MYGLKQAPWAWKKRIICFLKEIDFKKCVFENGVYVKKDTNESLIILCIYVKDFFITSSDKGFISRFKGELMKEFEMTDLDLMTYFLCIEFYKSKKGLLMHQSRHALEILKKFEIEHCNVAITPNEPVIEEWGWERCQYNSIYEVDWIL